MMETGAQMYTVRAMCKTPEGFSESLRRIADIGYRTVQVSGTCAYEAEWLRDRLKENGLRCVVTHPPRERLIGDTDALIRDHDVFGCGYIRLGYWSFDPESEMTLERYMSLFPEIARRLKAGGKTMMHHNHDGEFRRVGGRTVMDVLAESFPAEDMGFILDTFWVQAGGGDPAQWIEKLKGRVPCIHLKDYAYGRKMAVLGEGNINFDRVFEKAESAGCEYMLVEQDDCGGEDPFECLRRSYLYLKARGFR